MYFIIKLMLIILLNQTSAHITENVETTILPAWKPTRRNEILLTLKAFGKQIHLKLCRNDKTASSAFKKHDEKFKTKEEPQLNSTDSCYYHHSDHISNAVINICHQYGWEGIILLENDTLQIRPLQNDFASLTLADNSCIKEEANISIGKLHLIIRSLQPFANSNFHNINLHKAEVKRHVQDTHKKLTIKLAVFVDKTAYHTFMPILDEDEEKFHNMMLAYVNNIQALFHHSSLDTPIDILLVHLQIMDKNPFEFPIWKTEIENFLLTFCVYATAYNKPYDDRNHWDLALLLTGLNIYSWLPDQEKNFSDIGTSMQNRMCTTLSCAVVEFGVIDYITSVALWGFASSFVAAREIGNVLGMSYDEDAEPIPCKSDFIMSKYKKRRGQVTWSECSRIIAKELWDTKECLIQDRTTTESINYYFPEYDHSRYHNLPGREWNAKAQCEVYFHSKDANVVSLFDMCQSLECEAPDQDKAFTGPALEGTYCDPYINRFGHKKECRGGECVPITQPPYVHEHFGTDNWSEWKIESCQSSCLEKSKGVTVKRRFCTHGTNRSANCKGPYYDVVLCDDFLICANKFRQTISNFTEIKCTELSSLIKNYTTFAFEILKQPGHQTTHDVEKPWIACTIYCRREDMHDYYAPRLEMLGFNMDPYFPDGTWCHHDGEQEYHCRQHHCLPFLTINTKISKSIKESLEKEEL